jgi:hypothetical protein
MLTMKDIKRPSTKRKRLLSAYDGRRLLGRIEIMPRYKRTPIVKAIDAIGKRLGRFKSQKAAMRAIDAAAAAAARTSAHG